MRYLQDELRIYIDADQRAPLTVKGGIIGLAATAAANQVGAAVDRARATYLGELTPIAQPASCVLDLLRELHSAVEGAEALLACLEYDPGEEG